MVIRGKTRGNGRQLAQYLITMGENEDIQILEVAGRHHADEDYLLRTMHHMAFTSELAKGAKGFHHAEINPDPANGEDRAMTFDDWIKAADILGEELGLQDQRRVIVLHDKKDRLHAHVAWERYDHAQGKMISDSFSRLAQDRARHIMERVFQHRQTPYRNKQRPELKTAMTEIWNQTETGAEFIKTVYDRGYMVAQGVPDRPFMVVDENGHTFDLVRQIKGARTKDVRNRLRNEQLVPEKEAIVLMRQKQKSKDSSGKKGQKTVKMKLTPQQSASQFSDNRIYVLGTGTGKAKELLAEEFAETRDEATQDENQEKKKIVAEQFAVNSPELVQASQDANTENEGTEKVIIDFSQNTEMTHVPLTEEQEIQKLMQEQRDIRQRMKQKNKRRIR